MSNIPAHLLKLKPELKTKDRLTRSYKDTIPLIIDWVVEVDSYFFDIEFENYHQTTTSQEYIDTHYIKTVRDKSNSDFKNNLEILSILKRCQKFNSKLLMDDLILFLGLKPKRSRGRPRGKSTLISDLDIGVKYYRRLRKILNAEYNIEAKEAIINRIAHDWDIDKQKLKEHLKRSKQRVDAE